MDKIIIYDNVLSDDEQKQLSSIINTLKWVYTGNSLKNNASPISTTFWHSDLIDNLFFTETLKQKIEKITNKKFKVDRVYANGHTFGQDGTYHKDVDIISPTVHTFCLYTNPFVTEETAEHMGGDIVFKLTEENNMDNIISIESHYNRAVFFPSYYVHKGMAYNRYCKSLRVSIAWKLTEIVESESSMETPD